MSCTLTEFDIGNDRCYRWSGQHSRTALERINRLYAKSCEKKPPSLVEARLTLFDAASRTSEIERTLVALIDHPNQEATALLEHPALLFKLPRLAFVLRLARRRRRRRLAEIAGSNQSAVETFNPIAPPATHAL